MLDLGTGDGRFVSISAAANPDKFYIGIDANVKPLEKPSMRATRKSAKGGLPNALFVQAAVEDLPSELDGIATEVHIQFPWGSLLRAVVVGETWFIEALRRLCAPRAKLTVVVGLDEVQDRSEIGRLGIPPLRDEYLRGVLLSRYEAAGFTMSEIKSGSGFSVDLNTSWAKRLTGRPGRKMVYIVLKAR